MLYVTKSHDNHEKVVHRPYSNCISSVQEIHKDSIKFSLSSTDKGVVDFIPAQELAILTITPLTFLYSLSLNIFTPAHFISSTAFTTSSFFTFDFLTSFSRFIPSTIISTASVLFTFNHFGFTNISSLLSFSTLIVRGLP